MNSYFSPLNEHVERHLCVLWSFFLLTFVPPTTGSITHHRSPRTLMDTLTGRLVSAFVYDRFQENVPFVQCKCISLWMVRNYLLSHKSEVNSVWFSHRDKNRTNHVIWANTQSNSLSELHRKSKMLWVFTEVHTGINGLPVGSTPNTHVCGNELLACRYSAGTKFITSHR